MTVKDLVKYAIVEPYLYETHKAQILRAQEEERQRQIRMQRPAILRLVEAQDLAKVAEIIETEFVREDEPTLTDFDKLQDDMADQEVTMLGPIVSEYILK